MLVALSLAFTMIVSMGACAGPKQLNISDPSANEPQISVDTVMSK